jgi:hypothetical protein
VLSKLNAQSKLFSLRGTPLPNLPCNSSFLPLPGPALQSSTLLVVPVPCSALSTKASCLALSAKARGKRPAVILPVKTLVLKRRSTYKIKP